MQELINIHNQGSELRCDSRDVAKLFGVEHQNLRETIESHKEQMEALGVFRFETGKPIPGSAGGRPERFCYLTFDQLAFLLTVTKATEVTKDFRLRLIIAFRDARNKLRPIDHALLTIPAPWRKTFPDSFYSALLKLYGNNFDASGDKPGWVGKWTNRFIYEPLFEKLPGELKGRRFKHSGQSGPDAALKLHQYLEENSKENLKTHIIRVTTLLETALSRGDFLERFAALFYGAKQLHLLLPQVADEFGDDFIDA